MIIMDKLDQMQYDYRKTSHRDDVQAQGAMLSTIIELRFASQIRIAKLMWLRLFF